MVAIHPCVILQSIAKDREISTDSHKSSAISMLDFLKSKYTASNHDWFRLWNCDTLRRFYKLNWQQFLPHIHSDMTQAPRLSTIIRLLLSQVDCTVLLLKQDLNTDLSGLVSLTSWFIYMKMHRHVLVFSLQCSRACLWGCCSVRSSCSWFWPSVASPRWWLDLPLSSTSIWSGNTAPQLLTAVFL